MEQESRLTIRSDVREIPRISDELGQIMEYLSFSPDEILDTQLAVEEAVTNIILHGYPPKGGEITLRFETAPRQIRIRIEDSAPPFDPLSLPEPDISAAMEDRKIGGLGVFLIRQLMDSVTYLRDHEKNILVLEKRGAG